MSVLTVLFPQVRAEVLRLLFADASRELHLRDLTRQSGLGLGTVQDELEKLSSSDLVTSRRDGNRRYYRANSAHPLFPDLQQLVLKTSGLHDVLAKALDGIKGVELAFVFGSLASSGGKAASDVDLFIIGDVGLRGVTTALRGVAEVLAREINPITMTAEEFRKRRANDSFVQDVLGKEKLFVKGNANELERLG